MALSIPIISSFDNKGISSAINEFKNLETNGKKAQFAIKKAAVPAGIAIAGLGVALFDAAKGAMEDDAAQQLLATTLRPSQNDQGSRAQYVQPSLGDLRRIQSCRQVDQ